MPDALYVLIRLLHVGSAIALVGGGTLWGAVLAPTLAQMGPTLPKGAMPTLGGKVVKFLPASALVALVTGVLLFESIRPYAPEAWRTLMLAALVLLLAILVVSYLVGRTFRKFVHAVSAGPPGPEAQAHMARIRKGSVATLAMGWTVVLLMVVATSLRTA
jgi:uncharacterized membrane protein